MSKKVWILCCFLLAICLGISQWHTSLIQDDHALEVEGWHYVSEALCDRIDERDEYISLLEELLQQMVTPQDIDITL